jgi:hypothetical protein
VKTRKAVLGVLANHALEGMEPDRESITNLCACARGDIDKAECNRRADWPTTPPCT